MSPRLRLAVPILLGVVVVIVGALLAGGGGLIAVDPSRATASAGAGDSAAPGGPGGSGEPGGTPVPTPTERPVLGGTELYGYLPYWHITDAEAAYLDSVPVTTLALFSVSARRNGAIDARDVGHRRITGPLGRQVIAAAHTRGQRVDLVFTSFGGDRNGVFFGRLPRPPAATSSAAPSPGVAPTAGPPTPSPATAETAPPPAEAPWHRTVPDLVDLVVDLGVDGLNVDVEQLDELDRQAYGEFLLALRAALTSAVPGATLSVATEAGLRGTGNAIAAAAAGVDRLFLMGYDYHWSGSQPGASSPVDRSDGIYTLRWSIDQYVEAGIPRDRILLGLPLYGMSWRTTGPDRTAPVLGSGTTWIPNRHLDVLLDPTFQPGRDPLEVAEFFVRPEGENWRVTYYDSPATLRAKLALARDQGLAGGGFWAIGYERGLPGYLPLMRDFRDGNVPREEAPPVQ
jgi:Glycosyl hydrolases family 18